MRRLSITMSDELMVRLEPIKERINVSQVCREALERRIIAFEGSNGKEGDNLDKENLITRLREERTLIEGKFEDLGRHNASAWLETVSYVDLRNVAEIQNTPDMDRYRLPRAAFQTMKIDMAEAKVSCEGAHATAYKTAWLDYVIGIWDEVVSQVEETRDTEPVEASG